MGALSAIARRRFAAGRTRDLAFAIFFFAYAAGQTSAYRSSYPTLQDRVDLAKSFGDDKAVRLFYGVPHDLLTVGGYAAWRVAGVLAIFVAARGLLAAVRSMRAEEDSGHEELILANAVSRRTSFYASLAGGALGAAIIWAGVWLGLVAGKLPAGESALLALGNGCVGLFFVGVGALVSQLASTRRLALELGALVLGVFFVLRVIADTASSLDWVRFLTPFGWAEDLRPFTGSRPAFLILLLGVPALLIAAAGWISMRRDVGVGLIQAPDTKEPDPSLLTSPTAQALRDERGRLAAWVIGGGVFAIVIGLLADSVSSASVSESLNQQLQKLGVNAIATPSSYIAISFLVFILLVSLFTASQIAAARHEEADQRLETLLSQRVGRGRWLAGRLALATGGAVLLALAIGALTWVGAAVAGADVSFADMLGAGANCLPIALLFLGLGALAFALLPRATSEITYGLVLAAFIWELFGSLLDLPGWTVDLTPFHQVALVPAESFKAVAAIVMLAVAALAMLVAVRLFERRDLTGA
jgi:ABC-2 type transport system permease protein